MVFMIIILYNLLLSQLTWSCDKWHRANYLWYKHQHQDEYNKTICTITVQKEKMYV